MTDAAPAAEEGRTCFEVAPSTIPVGVPRNAVGSLVLDDALPEHRSLFAIWRDQATGDCDTRGSV